MSQVGLFAEWCRSSAVLHADRVCREAVHRQRGTSYLYSNPQKYNVRLVPTPFELNRDDHRLICADWEDWECLEDILEAVGPDYLDWHQIVDLLEGQPALRAQMALRNRAEAGTAAPAGKPF